MYGHTQRMAEVIARQISERGIRNIRVYDSSKTHTSYIINDIFKYKGLIIGSCAYNNSIFPNVEILLSTIEHMAVKNHYFGYFGNFLWNGGGVSNLRKFAETMSPMGWENIFEPVEEKGSLKPEKFQLCIELANAMADKLLAME
jgi:flavorubredoxin